MQLNSFKMPTDDRRRGPPVIYCRWGVLPRDHLKMPLTFMLRYTFNVNFFAVHYLIDMTTSFVCTNLVNPYIMIAD